MTGTAAIHADLIAGRRRAVAWGAGAMLPYLLMQAPYGVDAVIDASAPEDGSGRVAGLPVLRPDALAGMDPDRTAIVPFADLDRFGDEIAAQLSAYGPFPMAPPFLAARDAPFLAESESAARRQRLRYERALRRLLVEARDTRAGKTAVMRRAVLWVHQICKGGAERQICLLAMALSRRGWDVHLVTAGSDAPHTASLADALAASGVARIIMPAPREIWDDLLRDGPLRRQAMALAPYFVAKGVHRILCTTRLLHDLRPELLVSYLDDGNLVAGVAGVLAAVPRILMSARNCEPNQIDELVDFPVEKPRLASVYRALLSLPGVRLMANSTLGARSYEKWLRLARGSMPVVHNGLQSLDLSPNDAFLRGSLGISADAPVAMGIMRLEPQKDPLAFVQVMHEVMRENPAVHAILVGDGGLRGAVEEAVAATGNPGRFHLLGMRDDVPACLAAADILLSTSRVEGLPNAVLEAQRQGRPVVATDAGGTREALAPCLLPLLCPVGDITALARACASLLSGREGSQALGMVARSQILDGFSLDTLATSTLRAAGLAEES